MPQLSFPCLCLVTDRQHCNGRPLEEVVSRAVDGGVNLVQLREKDLSARELYSLAARIRKVTEGRALLFINDRTDVALACDADGVQLGEEGLPLKAARRVAGERLMLGRSVHSVEGAVAAQSEGADILVVGTIFPTGSHPGAAAADVGLLRAVKEGASVPFLAIGGVKAGNIGAVIEAGASGAAVISAITRSPDPALSSATLIKNMQDAWASTHGERLARQA